MNEMGTIGLVKKVKGFLFDPTETFRKVKEETLSDSLKYLVVLLIIFSAVYAVVLTAMKESL